MCVRISMAWNRSSGSSPSPTHYVMSLAYAAHDGRQWRLVILVRCIDGFSQCLVPMPESQRGRLESLYMSMQYYACSRHFTTSVAAGGLVREGLTSDKITGRMMYSSQHAQQTEDYGNKGALVSRDGNSTLHYTISVGLQYRIVFKIQISTHVYTYTM